VNEGKRSKVEFNYKCTERNIRKNPKGARERDLGPVSQFLTSALDEGEWQLHPRLLYSRENSPQSPLDRRTTQDPKAVLDAVEERKSLPSPQIELRPSSP
jgi:hypothetical protein